MPDEMVICPECDGDGYTEDECYECNGGYDPPLDENGEEGSCYECLGSGRFEEDCGNCEGTGEVKVND